MQRELFNNMLGGSLYVYMFQLQRFEGGHEADVAHGEHEFDTPGVMGHDFLHNNGEYSRIIWKYSNSHDGNR